jgi:hypothetical protein
MGLSWEAVERGDVYCSPACGAKCTKAAYDKAMKAAGELVKRLGEEWTSRVWENMGWYYSAISGDGHTKVHANHYMGAVSYTAFIGSVGSGGRWAESGETPEEAIAKTRATALAELREGAEWLGAEVIKA